MYILVWYGICSILMGTFKVALYRIFCANLYRRLYQFISDLFKVNYTRDVTIPQGDLHYANLYTVRKQKKYSLLKKLVCCLSTFRSFQWCTHSDSFNPFSETFLSPYVLNFQNYYREYP